jgi:hypothetical protein
VPKVSQLPSEKKKEYLCDLIVFKRNTCDIRTFEELGARIGIAPNTMSKYAKNYTKMPIGIFEKMKRVLKLSDEETLIFFREAEKIRDSQKSLKVI